MAKNKLIPIDGKTRILKNGAVYDNEKKKIVAMRPELAEKNTQITKSNAGEYQAQRHQRKRNIIAAAAAAAVERDDYRLAYGGDAWIAAIAETQYIKATTPDDPKSTDAARFLLQETGLSEKQQVDSADKPQTATDTAIVALINAMTQAITANGFDNSNYRKHPGDVVDGDATPADDTGGEEGGGVGG
jgi:serine/threonine protein phosphatase PrpC